MAIARRRFLQACGLGAGALFLPSLLDRRGVAVAGPPAPPMRLVVLFTEHGVAHAGWHMRGDRPADAAWAYDLAPTVETEWSDALRPLHRHRGKATIVDGLALATALADPYGDAHAKGWCAALTGAIARATADGVSSHARLPSLDQRVAAHARAADPALTDLVSLELGINQRNVHAALYRDPGDGGPVARVPHEAQPRALYDRLFPYAGGPPGAIALAQPDVLAQVSAMYDAMAAPLGVEDRRKLELHRDLVHDLGARLDALQATACPAPVLAAPGATSAERYLANVDGFWDLATAALACGLSRVVSLQLGTMPMSLIGGSGYFHSDYAHPSAPGQAGDPRHAEAVRGVVAATARHAGWVAALADRLDAIPEGNGTLLDHTIVLWVSELAHGGHGLDGWPAVIVGGGARLHTGRYVHVAHDTPTTALAPWVDERSRIGLPHNHLLVAIAQAMGLPTDTIGDASVRPKQAGLPPIDLRGPLPGLLRRVP